MAFPLVARILEEVPELVMLKPAEAEETLTPLLPETVALLFSREKEPPTELRLMPCEMIPWMRASEEKSPVFVIETLPVVVPGKYIPSWSPPMKEVSEEEAVLVMAIFPVKVLLRRMPWLFVPMMEALVFDIFRELEAEEPELPMEMP